MIRIILKPRGGGKSFELIKMAHERGGYIVCHGESEATRLKHEAKEHGFNINFPITYDEFISKQYYGRGIKEFYFDNLDHFIQFLSRGVPVVAVTMNGKNYDNALEPKPESVE